MKKNVSSRIPGFTLIEVLLYVSIAGILLTGITTFFLITVQARTKYQTISEVENQGSQVVNLIAQTIRNGTALTTPPANSSAASISITTAVASTTPTIFDLSGGTVRITEGANTAAPITSSRVIVSNLVFYNLTRTNAPSSIRFQFTLSSVNPANKNEYEFSQTFYGAASLRYK